ncbi:MAG: TlpA family protein disulfide reductase [Lachnospiraceae bacterium]|nr:TlpA family protein disulfide reductase [Lachnospiraceae bacterium]
MKKRAALVLMLMVISLIASACGKAQPKGSTAFIDAGLLEMQVPDPDGQEHRLGDVVAQNKVTLLNYWGTFCDPCIDEMPDIEELSAHYADQGFGVIGLTCDVMDPGNKRNEDNYQKALDIIETTGVTYPILFATEEVQDTIKANMFPTSYFLDSEGHILGDPVVGSHSAEDWESYILEHLK